MKAPPRKEADPEEVQLSEVQSKKPGSVFGSLAQGEPIPGEPAAQDRSDADLGEPLTVEEHHRWIIDQADRRECLRVVERIGQSVRHFLDARQPALGDMTGRELLEEQPGELLKRLRELEGGLEQ